MSQPPAYERQFDFSDFQSTAPATPLPGNQVDAELNAVKTTTDAIRQNLAAIQRDDGQLANQSVHPESVSNATLTMLNSDLVQRGAWVTSTVYAVNDLVTESSNVYLCLVAHTAGVFATDLAAGKWALLTRQGIAADGSTTITANIPMGGFKFTGLGDGSARTDSATLGQIQDQAFQNGGTAGGTADALTVSVTPAITAYAAPFTVFFFSGASPNTGAATLNVNSVGATAIVKNGAALVAGDIQASKFYAATYHSGSFHLWSPDAAKNLYVLLAGNQTISGNNTLSGTNTHSGTSNFTGTLNIAGVGLLAAMRGHIAGLTLSNNASDASNDIDVAAGAATADDQSAAMVLAAGLVKRLDATWAVGTNQGMLATGVAIANTTYHIFLIRRPDTGVVDIAADTSASGANLAANTNAAYTQKRRIGSILRAAGAIRAFRQNGDLFKLVIGVADRDTTAAAASALLALTIPAGIVVRPILGITLSCGTSVVCTVALGDAAVGSANSDVAVGQLGAGDTVDNTTVMVPANFSSNTSSQIYFSQTNTAGTPSASRLTTSGWVDSRGKDA